MSLLADALAEVAARRGVSRCWFTRLTPDDQVALERYFATDLMTSKIGEALRTSGVPISDFRVGYHRRRKCSCP